MEFFKVKNLDGSTAFGAAETAPQGAKIMSEAVWLREKAAAMQSSMLDHMAERDSVRPVSLFAARKVLRDTKAADGKSYMEKIKAGHKAGKVSDDAMDAIEMLDPVSRSSPWVAEIQALFELSNDDVDSLFEKMRAIQV
jgi:hypothetical protein